MEPKTLKPAKLWWLVAVNYLSSFFIASLLGSVILFGIAWITGDDIMAGELAIHPLIIIGIYLLCLILTTWNAARYLRARYVIPNPKEVVGWTAGLFVAITVSAFVVDYAEFGFPDTLAIVSSVLSLVVFFVVSRKFLRA